MDLRSSPQAVSTSGRCANLLPNVASLRTRSRRSQRLQVYAALKEVRCSPIKYLQMCLDASRDQICRQACLRHARRRQCQAPRVRTDTTPPLRCRNTGWQWRGSRAPTRFWCGCRSPRESAARTCSGRCTLRGCGWRSKTRSYWRATLAATASSSTVRMRKAMACCSFDAQRQGRCRHFSGSSIRAITQSAEARAGARAEALRVCLPDSTPHVRAGAGAGSDCVSAVDLSLEAVASIAPGAGAVQLKQSGAPLQAASGASRRRAASVSWRLTSRRGGRSSGSRF